MELLKSKGMALLIMAASVFASMLLVGASIGSGVLTAAIVTAVLLCIDVVLAKLRSSSQRAAGLVIVAVSVVALCVLGSAIGAHNTEISPSGPVHGGVINTSASEAPSEPLRDESYELGLAYYEAGKYQDAIETLRKVSEGSTFYVNAQKTLLSAIEGYRSGLADSARPYAEDGNYPVAISILSEGLAVVPDDAELKKRINEYSTAYAAEVRTSAVESASTAAAEGDYATAITDIQTAIEEIGEDAELTALKSDYGSKYREKLVTQATALLEARDYDGGLELLQNGQNILPDDEGLTAAIADYEKHKPLPLENLDYFTGSGYLTVRDNLKNNLGESYSHVVTAYEMDKTYLINGQYSAISGTLFQTYEGRSATYDSSYIGIYGDDEWLYSTSVKGGSMPVDFYVDLTGVLKLRVVCHCVPYYSDHYGAVANLVLWPTVDK